MSLRRPTKPVGGSTGGGSGSAAAALGGAGAGVRGVRGVAGENGSRVGGSERAKAAVAANPPADSVAKRSGDERSAPGERTAWTPPTGTIAAPGTPVASSVPGTSSAPGVSAAPGVPRAPARERSMKDPTTGPMVGAPTGPSVVRPSGQGRRARLRVTRVNPLSVTRLTFAFSLCVFVVLMVAVAVLWFVLNSIGVFDSVVHAADTLTDGSNGGVRTWLSFARAMELGLLIGAINVILMTALATLGALLYNLCTEMVGGIEVVLGDQ